MAADVEGRGVGGVAPLAVGLGVARGRGARDGRGGREQQVDRAQHRVDRVAGDAAHPQRVKVVGCREASAGQVVEAGARSVATAVLAGSLVVEVVLGGDDHEVGAHRVVQHVQRGAGHGHQLEVQLAARAPDVGEHAGDVVLHAHVRQVPLGHAQAHRRGTRPHLRRALGRLAPEARRRVTGVGVDEHGSQHGRCVRRGAREDAHLRDAPFAHALAWDVVVPGLDAVEQMLPGWQPDRAAAVGTDRGERQTGCDGRTAPTRRPHRPFGREPRVARRWRQVVFAGEAPAELVEVVLAEHDGAGRAKPPDRLGVALRDPIAHERRVVRAAAFPGSGCCPWPRWARRAARCVGRRGRARRSSRPPRPARRSRSTVTYERTAPSKRSMRASSACTTSEGVVSPRAIAPATANTPASRSASGTASAAALPGAARRRWLGTADRPVARSRPQRLVGAHPLEPGRVDLREGAPPCPRPCRRTPQGARARRPSASTPRGSRRRRRRRLVERGRPRGVGDGCRAVGGHGDPPAGRWATKRPRRGGELDTSRPDV